MSRGSYGCAAPRAFAVASFVASTTLAQAPGPVARAFPVIIEGEPPQARYVLGYEGAPPFAQCLGACAFQGYPAEYRLAVSGQGLREGSRTFELTGPSRVVVEPRTEDQRSAGLVLGLVGVSLVAAGATLMLAQDSSRGEGGVLLLGLVTFATGAVLTPVGFVRYGRSSPGISVEPL